MIFISEDERPPDTYEHAMALTDKQIASEQAVRDELDALESDLTELWDDYYEIPYGSKYHIRIRAELPGSIERQLHKLLNDDLDAGKSDKELIKVLAFMTAGIYALDEGNSSKTLISKTDSAFWNNPANWNMRKVESILMSYLGRLQEERTKIFSFLGAQTPKNADSS